MQDAALEYGKHFFDTYIGDAKDLVIVEIGSQDVNGSLRSLAPPNNKYIGVDFVESKGVDIVITDLTLTLPTRTGGFTNLTLFLKIQPDQNSASVIFEILDDATPIAERLVFIGDTNDDGTVTFTIPLALDGSVITVTATTVGQDVTIRGGGTNNQDASYLTSFEVS